MVKCTVSIFIFHWAEIWKCVDARTREYGSRNKISHSEVQKNTIDYFYRYGFALCMGRGNLTSFSSWMTFPNNPIDSMNLS